MLTAASRILSLAVFGAWIDRLPVAIARWVRFVVVLVVGFTPLLALWTDRINYSDAMLWLVRQKQVAPGETLEFVAGMYDPTKPQGQAEMTSSVSIVVTGGTSLSLSQPTGTIEVTSVTADSISGKFDVKDKWTQLSGEFHAPLK